MFGGQQEVDGLTSSIDRALQIFPLAFNFDVGFVHSANPQCACVVLSSGGTKRITQR
ncbi:hypothetical protein BJM06_a00050 (plasmid) [Enterobacter cloacae]|nr:hypothetical protein BJM06_a00050 [Enterobacter cloacae]